MKRILKITFLLFTTWFLIHTIYIVSDGMKDENKKADVALILGNKVNPDGKLSERLEKRLVCGLDLFNKKRVNKIIVSGGLGVEGHFEGTIMRNFLVQKGIPDSLIIIDNLGNNTIASVNNTLKFKDSLNFKSIIVVSQYYHLTRTKMLFRNRDFQHVSSVSPNYFEFRDFYSILREFFAYYLES